MIRLYVAATVALLACQACGSARSTPSHPEPDGAGSGSATGSAGRTAPATGNGGPTDVGERDHPSDQECEALFAHAVAVEQEQRPADQRLGEPELANVRAKLREQKLPACRELSRATVRCMIAAPTLPALTACS